MLDDLFTHEGETLTVRAWACRLGQTPDRVLKRLQRGWSTREALFPEVRSTQHIMLSHNDKTMSINDWAIVTGLSASAIYNRLRKWDWTVEDTLTKPARRYRRMKLNVVVIPMKWIREIAANPDRDHWEFTENDKILNVVRIEKTLRLEFKSKEEEHEQEG